jgi:hypothetical protein
VCSPRAALIEVIDGPKPWRVPFVDTRRTPSFWCNFSVGYQKEAFETVFGRPVQAVITTPKRSGTPRCAFESTLAQAPARMAGAFE